MKGITNDLISLDAHQCQLISKILFHPIDEDVTIVQNYLVSGSPNDPTPHDVILFPKVHLVPCQEVAALDSSNTCGVPTALAKWALKEKLDDYFLHTYICREHKCGRLGVYFSPHKIPGVQPVP